METLQTQRLTLIPLTQEQLETGLRSINALSLNLGISLVSTLFDGIVQKAVNLKIEKMKQAPSLQHPWYTYFLIVCNTEKVGVGMIGFKGVPDANGAVEIGYGIDENYQRHGYMTEAVCEMVKWAFTHPDCKVVTASVVAVDNFASQKVLVKAGFSEVSSSEEGVNYIFRRSIRS